MAKKVGHYITRPGRKPEDAPITIPVAEDLETVPGIPSREKDVSFFSRYAPLFGAVRHRLIVHYLFELDQLRHILNIREVLSLSQLSEKGSFVCQVLFSFSRTGRWVFLTPLVCPGIIMSFCPPRDLRHFVPAIRSFSEGGFCPGLLHLIRFRIEPNPRALHNSCPLSEIGVPS